MATFKLSILSPAGKAFEGDAESVVGCGQEGQFGVLAHHAPMIVALRTGVTTVTKGGDTQYFFTGEGVLEVSREEVVMLVDEAMRVDNLAAAKDLVRERAEKTTETTPALSP